MKTKLGILIVIVLFCSIFILTFYYAFQGYEQPTFELKYKLNYTTDYVKAEKKDVYEYWEKVYEEAKKFDLKQILCDKLYDENLDVITRYTTTCTKWKDLGESGCVCYKI